MQKKNLPYIEYDHLNAQIVGLLNYSPAERAKVSIQNAGDMPHLQIIVDKALKSNAQESREAAKNAAQFAQ